MSQRGENAQPGTAGDMRLFGLLHALPDAELEFILERAIVDTFKKGEARPATPGFASHLYLVWRGRLRITSTTPGGAQVTLLSAGPGDHFGELSIFAEQPPSHFDMFADLPCVLLRVPEADVRAVMARNAALTAALLTALAQRAVVLSDRLFELVTLNARGRLLAEVLRLAMRGRRVGKTAVAPALTHEVLASHVGLTREAVSRHMKMFREEGLLSGVRGAIVVPDLPRLAAAVHAEAGARASYQLER